MKNTAKLTYIVEVYASYGCDYPDYPEWLKEATHKTLVAARKHRTTILNTTDRLAREVRIVKSIREVVR